MWQLFVPIAEAQYSVGAHGGSGDEISAFEAEKPWLSKTQAPSLSEASPWFDVTYDSLALTIDPARSYLNGVVTIGGVFRLDSCSQLTLDLMNTMTIDSIFVGNVRVSFVQAPSSFTVTLDRTYHAGEYLAARITYEGSPIATGFGSVVFTHHDGVPWFYTLSEPYGARDWWPCKNDQTDKADSADIYVTCDSIYRVGSQGTLVSVTPESGGRTTTHWRERYPIASYLISVTLSNFSQFTNWYRYSQTDSMMVLNYIIPEDLAAAMASLSRVPEMLSIYSALFGQYPFIKEKYGHAEFGSGGMEHQTMTSLGTFNENVVAHELAHQWFGDMITCRTWSDLWLNEGFAQYSTALYLEKKYGKSSYRSYVQTQMVTALSAGGRIGAPDTSTPATLFNSPLIYSKGATVLHMLRHVVGDTMFFRGMKAYASDPQLRYATAATSDLERDFESVYGRSLAYFFNEWIYGNGYPEYLYSWQWSSSGTSHVVELTITQNGVAATPSFFTMPIDVKLSYPGYDTTVSVFDNASSQTFFIPSPTQPTTVSLDPDDWILKRSYPSSEIPPNVATLAQNYPNPFNSGTRIEYSLPGIENVSLEVFDLLGRRLARLVSERQPAGTYEVTWSPAGLASGVYVYRLTAGDTRIQKKMTFVR